MGCEEGLNTRDSPVKLWTFSTEQGLVEHLPPRQVNYLVH